MYTPLYVKSNYTFLSSLVKIDELVKKCKDNNIKQVALCDDNMIATMYFYKECLKADIKPIIGLEINIDNNDILLYAKNYLGYQNLLKIVTLKDKNSFDLLKTYNKNIICVLPYKNIHLYKEISLIFNDLYIGVINKDEEINSLNETKNVVFINKVLYLEKKEQEYFKYLIMMKEKKNVFDNIEYKDNYNYLLNDKDILDLVSKKTIDLTNKLADSCLVEFPKSENMIPHFNNNLNISSDEYLKKLSIKGLEIRLDGNVNDVYKKRLLYELDVIKKMGFPDYFLIVYDYVKYAKKSGILVGPGRGSAGGSLVAYSLGIIDVDPIKYDLLFERFLNPGRVTMPDIDIDFPDIYRDQVIDYARDKYGKKNVAGIVAIGTLKAKACLDEVARILKIEQTKIDRLKKFIDDKEKLKLKQVYESKEEFRNIVDNDERLTKLYQLSLIFEEFPKNTSTHASGVIISSKELDDIIPLIKVDGVYNCGYEAEYLEELGLLKMDFLAIKALTTIMNIIENVNKQENISLNFTDIPLDDKDTLNLFYNVDTNGIFQFESDAMKHLLKGIKVTRFDDIVAADALVRPGPDTKTYIERKENKTNVEYPNDSIKRILEPTYGVLVYQEQIMQIANVMAGFTMSEADLLRRAMSKKKKDLLSVQEEKFINGAIKNGYEYNVAKKYYEDILAFAEYGFNKSHAVAYSILAYKMGYLKAHFPKYFYLNILSMEIGKDVKSSKIIREARAKGVKFYLPSINKSTEKYEVVEDGILFPLSNIKSIGINTAEEIKKARGEGFIDLFDCFIKLTEIGINRKTFELLTYSSCFDSFGINKRTIIENLDNLLNFSFIAKGMPKDMIEQPEIEEYPEYDSSFLMNKEKELFGFYLSFHPTTKYKDQYKVINLIDLNKHINKVVDVIVLVEKIKVHEDKKGSLMAFITGSDEVSSIELIAFSEEYEKIKELTKGNILLVQGKVELRNNIQMIIKKSKIIG